MLPQLSVLLTLIVFHFLAQCPPFFALQLYHNDSLMDHQSIYKCESFEDKFNAIVDNSRSRINSACVSIVSTMKCEETSVVDKTFDWHKLNSDLYAQLVKFTHCLTVFDEPTGQKKSCKRILDEINNMAWYPILCEINKLNVEFSEKLESIQINNSWPSIFIYAAISLLVNVFRFWR